MTKHLAIATILRHMRKLNLIHTKGRSEAAAKLHLVDEALAPTRTIARSSQVIEPAPKKSQCDYWAERGEHGRWVRVHAEPRTTKFDPGAALRGPGRKTRLSSTRRSVGVYENGEDFDNNDEWQTEGNKKERLPWTGKTIFIVDYHHTKDFGTDQRRQRATAHNKLESATYDR